MSNFHSNQEITKRLSDLTKQLEEQRISEEELVEFEQLSRQLYERAVILNYKAKEEKVYANKSPEESTSDDIPSAVAESPSIEEPEPVETKDDVSNDAFTNSGEIAFDFSSDEAAEEPASLEFENQDAIETKKDDVSEEPAVIEEQVAADTEQEEVVSNTVNIDEARTKSFYEQFEKVHKASLGDRLGASKLETLKGAIGLNDKLQFIAELFNGDSDAFNASINELDQQNSNEEARKLLSQIAAKHEWNEESPLVEEFARLIERRYVEV